MADWRWVTVVNRTQMGGATFPEHQGQWINLDSVDIIRPLEGAKFHHANTLLIGMDPINRMLITEKIDPTQPEPGEQHQQQPTTEE